MKSVKNEKLVEKFFFMYSKNFNISDSISIRLLIFDNLKRFLILKNNLGIIKYIHIPQFIFVNKNDKALNFKYIKKSQLSKFFRSFFNLYQELKYKIFETIIIKGVGLKVTLIEKPIKMLELKLGYSHKILLVVPQNLNIIVKKKKFLVEGINKIIVGNFVNKIINFKPLNNYTGKGLWLKSYQKFILKDIKKI